MLNKLTLSSVIENDEVFKLLGDWVFSPDAYADFRRKGSKEC